jgi:hypothetical protein
MTGNSNVAVGSATLFSNTGSNNTAIGDSVAENLSSGNNNTILGFTSGGSLTSGSNNIYINNVGANESDTTRIGTQGTQLACFIAGINNVTSTSLPNVFVDPTTGQLEVSGITGSSLDIPNTIVVRDSTGSFAADNINVDGYLNLTALQSTGPSGTTGSILKGGHLFIHNIGGSGVTTNTAVGLGAINPAVTGANNTAIGTSALNAVTSGNANTAVGNSALSANTTGQDNVGVGYGALGSITTGIGNVGIGANALNVGATGDNNIGIGINVAPNLVTGNDNTILGSQAAGSLTNGSNNTILGWQAADNLINGSNNTILGQNAGNTLSTGSNNIYINTIGGTSTESDTTRIGTQGGASGQTACYVAGITNVTTALPPNIYINPSTGQLQLSTFNPAMFSVQSTANPDVSSATPMSPVYNPPGGPSGPTGTFSTLPTSGPTGSFYPTTGVFTAGYTGAYQFNGAGQLLVNGPGTTPTLSLYLNNEIFDQSLINVTGPTFSETANISLSTIMAMNMGDMAQIEFSNYTATGDYNVNVAYFSCSYIGLA